MSWTIDAAQHNNTTVITKTLSLGGNLYGLGVNGTASTDRFKVKSGSAWTSVGTTGTPTFGAGGVVFSGKIYAINAATIGALGSAVSSWGVGDASWASLTTNDFHQLGVLSTDLYGIGGPSATAGLARLAGGALGTVVSATMAGKPLCALEHAAVLFIGSDDGKVHTHNGVAAAFTLAHTFTGEYPTALGTHDGVLYCGTSIGNIYSWSGSAFDLEATLTGGLPIKAILSFNSTMTFCV